MTKIEESELKLVREREERDDQAFVVTALANCSDALLSAFVNLNHLGFATNHAGSAEAKRSVRYLQAAATEINARMNAAANGTTHSGLTIVRPNGGF